MSLKNVVLIVEPNQMEPQKLLNFIGENRTPINVSSPLRAMGAIQALYFNEVVVSSECVDHAEYASLFSVLRLVAPMTRVVCLYPGSVNG